MKHFPTPSAALSLALSLALSACATLPTQNPDANASPRPLPYLEPSQSDRCQNPEQPCTFSYDFEPSGAAIDVFAAPAERPQLLVLNEDGLLFHWSLSPNNPWNQDNVSFARSLDSVLRKGESATSGVCNGVPVFLAAANFMPGWTGVHPKRERVVAVIGSLDAEPQILHELSTAIRDVARREGVAWAKVEGLALSADCKTLHVGFRSVHNAELSEEIFTTLVHSFRIDLGLGGDGAGSKLNAGPGGSEAELGSENAQEVGGTKRGESAEALETPSKNSSRTSSRTRSKNSSEDRSEDPAEHPAKSSPESVEHLGSRTFELEPTCSGEKEGISGLDILPDGSLLALSSYELEIQGRSVPLDVSQGELGGSLWHIPADQLPGSAARTTPKNDAKQADQKIRRLACFPGHKPEAVVALEDGKSVRVLMEDDDYGGRPIHSFAVAIELPEDLRSDKAEGAGAVNGSVEEAPEGSVEKSGKGVIRRSSGSLEGTLD